MHVIDLLNRLRAKRVAEDDRQVCLERARILERCREEFGQLPRVPRQAAVVQRLCADISPVIGPDDLLVGRMPEVIPSAEEEIYIEANPDLFSMPGVPGLLDSMSICIPDWERLVSHGLGGIREETVGRLKDEQDAGRRQFLTAAAAAIAAVQNLLRRYAEAARHLAEDHADDGLRTGELLVIAERCERASVRQATGFIDALQASS